MGNYFHAAPFVIEEHTAGDGYRWRYRHYCPAGATRAHVVCLHGIQSHGGWYEYSCAKFCQAGYEVSFLDRRGAGLNERDRGDAPSFRRLLDDVAEFLGPVRSAGLPVYLLAISWAGKLAVACQRRHPGLVDGLVLVCPGLASLVGPTFRERLAILTARLISPRKLFSIPLSDPALFTATPRWQQFIQEDPLALRLATARLLLESARLDAYLQVVPRHVRTPALLLLAEHDRVIDNARARRYFGRLGSADKEIIKYPGAHHTLEFEPNPDLFIGDILRWLERRKPM